MPWENLLISGSYKALRHHAWLGMRMKPTKQGDFTKNGHVHIKSSVITSKAWYMMLIVPKIVLNTGFWIAWFQGWVVTIQAIFPVDIDELNYMISSLLVQCWWFNGIIKYDAVNPPIMC